MDRARDALSSFVGADSVGNPPVRNANAGVASALRSMELFVRPGDQLLTTANDYNAVRQVLRFTAEPPVPRWRPPAYRSRSTTHHGVTEAGLEDEAGGDRPHHIVDSSVVPNRRHRFGPRAGAPGARRRRPRPGQVPLAIDEWAPPGTRETCTNGSVRLRGRPFSHPRRPCRVPPVISHGYNALVEGTEDRYRLLFDWLGTDDFSAWAVIHDVLNLVAGLEVGGWDAVMKRNHELALEGQRIIAEAVGPDLPAPAEMVGHHGLRRSA